MEKKSFNQIKEEWYKTLRKHGFVDIENDRGAIKSDQYLKTKAQNKDIEAIREFYLRVDSYLSNCKNLNPLHRTILELYAQGFFHKEIALKVKKSIPRVRQIIKLHKDKTSTFLLL